MIKRFVKWRQGLNLNKVFYKKSGQSNQMKVLNPSVVIYGHNNH